MIFISVVSSMERGLFRNQIILLCTCFLTFVASNGDIEHWGLPLHRPQRLYLGSVSIGTPVGLNGTTGEAKKWFSVLLDTGSTGFWVFGKSMQGTLSEDGIKHHTFYSVDESVTFKSYDGDDSEFQRHYYGGLTAEGMMGLETVQIGNFTVNDVPFATINKTEDAKGHFDGLIGLGIKLGTPPLLVKLVEAGFAPNYVISFYFPHDGSASAVIGGIDPTLYHPGTLNYVNLEPGAKRWSLHVGLSLGSFNLDQVPCLFDTGASMNVGAFQTVDDMALSVGGTQDPTYYGRYLIRCNVRPLLPHLHIRIGKDTYSFSGEEYFRQDVKFKGYCVFFFLGRNDFRGLQLGVPFFHLYYTVFDYNAPRRLGFARLAVPGM